MNNIQRAKLIVYGHHGEKYILRPYMEIADPMEWYHGFYEDPFGLFFDGQTPHKVEITTKWGNIVTLCNEDYSDGVDCITDAMLIYDICADLEAMGFFFRRKKENPYLWTVDMNDRKVEKEDIHETIEFHGYGYDDGPNGPTPIAIAVYSNMSYEDACLMCLLEHPDFEPDDIWVDGKLYR